MSPLDIMTADTTSAQLDALVLGDWSPAIPPAWAVPVAVATVADASRYVQPVGRIPEGPQWWLSVGPGRVRVGRTDVARLSRREERNGAGWSHGYAVDASECVQGRDGSWLDDQSAQPVGGHSKLMRQQLGWARGEAVRHAAGVLADSGVITREDVPEPSAEPLGRFAPRARITEWSRKSRSNMVDRLSTLDFGPLFEQHGVPAMVTATLPECWELIAPTGKAFKRIVSRFVKRFERAWARRMRGIWKLEFQRRGAPHLHVLMVPPRGEVDGQQWRDWFASTWTTICLAELVRNLDGSFLYGEPVDLDDLRARMVAVHSHRLAACDYSEGLRATDPKRIAVYFSKHSTKGSGSKEYQHIVPALWQGEGDGPGRFWGYWGLERGDKATHVTADEAVSIIRTLRRWDRSKGGTRRSRETRVDTRTGVIRTRSVLRRTARMRGPGYLVVNDGPAVALMLAQLLQRT